MQAGYIELAHYSPIRVGGHPWRITPRLRHTYGTTLTNAGISFQALVALLEHATLRLWTTLRYANLASNKVRTADDAVMVKAQARQPILVSNQRGTVFANKFEYLHEEMLKTRLAAGLCARQPAPGPCSDAIFREQYDI